MDNFWERFKALKEKEHLGQLTEEEAETLAYMQDKVDDWVSDGEYS